MSEELRLLYPDWPAPKSVRACFTTRYGGHSTGPWRGFNLAQHVGDSELAVRRNRSLLTATLALADEPFWLQQVHGCEVVRLPGPTRGCAADGAITRTVGAVCAILVADCLPLLLCSADGREVAAVHAGWRGLEAGIIGRAVAAFAAPPAELLAWLGPAIGPRAYRVGDELRQRFTAEDSAHAAAFTAHDDGDDGWHMSLTQIALRQLTVLGVTRVSTAQLCVSETPQDYYSFRRDGVTGRMAALIWLVRP